jgi:hypothetical protein
VRKRHYKYYLTRDNAAQRLSSISDLARILESVWDRDDVPAILTRILKLQVGGVCHISSNSKVMRID